MSGRQVRDQLLARLRSRLPESTRGLIRAVRHGRTPPQVALLRRSRRLAARAGTARGVGGVLIGNPVRPRRARIVQSFDAWALVDEMKRTVSTVLDRAGIDHLFILPRQRDTGAILATPEERTDAALRALAAAPELATWWYRRTAGGSPGAPAPLAELHPTESRPKSVDLFQYLAAPSGELLADHRIRVRLEFWKRLRGGQDRPDGGCYPAGTLMAPQPNRVAAYLEPKTWDAAVARPGRSLPLSGLGHLFDVLEPVDIVYTWVDGADPAWLHRRSVVERAADPDELTVDALLRAHYQAQGELLYSLRSVEMYANWVRHIWIVTDAQVPSWLNTDHPRITVVDHRDIFSDTSALPVFNSHAIESQIHHIDGLSEHFLYLNDDVFFARPVPPSFFFHGNGIAKFFPSVAPLGDPRQDSRDLAALVAAKNNRSLVEAAFGRSITSRLQHTPHALLKSILHEIEVDHPDALEAVMRSKFRGASDYSLASSLGPYVAYLKGRAVPDSLRYQYVDLASSKGAHYLNALLWRHDYECFCINDTGRNPQNAAEQSRLMADFLRQYFPLPSSFEIA